MTVCERRSECANQPNRAKLHQIREKESFCGVQVCVHAYVCGRMRMCVYVRLGKKDSLLRVEKEWFKQLGENRRVLWVLI